MQFFLKPSLVLVSLALGGVASATTVTYDFTAITTDAEYGLATGTAVSGSFTINSSATGLKNSSNASAASFTGSNTTPAQQVFTASVNLGPTSTIGSIYSLSSITNGYDVIGGALSTVAGGTFAAQQGNGNGMVAIEFGPLPGYTFLSATSPLLNMSSVPAAIAANVFYPPTLEAYGQITNNNGPDLNFEFQTVTPVPLPASLPLLLGSLGVFGIAVRKKVHA
jgi:hypothetical protein